MNKRPYFESIAFEFIPIQEIDGGLLSKTVDELRSREIGRIRTIRGDDEVAGGTRGETLVFHLVVDSGAKWWPFMLEPSKRGNEM